MGCITSKTKGGENYDNSQTVAVGGDDATPQTGEGKNGQVVLTPGMYIQQQKGHLSDRYQRVKKLGSGAYGEVLLCIDKSSGAERAVKIIKKTSVSCASGTLLEEVAVLKQLDHPNIMKLYEFFEDKKNYYLVMELYSGGELFDEIISRQKFNEVDAVQVFKQIMAGTNYLHKAKIVHRDLKPENLLLEKKEKNANIKIVDFGLSAYYDGNKMRERLGTAYYVAPEVLKKKYDEKCDVWSCGVILYILLCGYPPFGGQTDQDILKKVEAGKFGFDPNDWKDVSQEAKHIITLMLHTEPAKRVSAEDCLNHPWLVKFSTKDAVVSDSQLSGALGNMKMFHNSQRLAQAAMLFMASNLTTAEEREELTVIFKSLDKNKDGHIDRSELIEGYCKLQNVKYDRNLQVEQLTIEEIGEEVDKMLEAVDLDGSGAIEYSEFVTASIDKQQLLSRDRLKNAFKQFDIDNSGKISRSELEKLIGLTAVQDEHWAAIVSSSDTNNDGEVDFEEFVTMMLKICDLSK